MRIIALTTMGQAGDESRTVFMNVDHIVEYSVAGKFTTVTTVAKNYYVRETPLDIMAQVMSTGMEDVPWPGFSGEAVQAARG